VSEETREPETGDAAPDQTAGATPLDGDHAEGTPLEQPPVEQPSAPAEPPVEEPPMPGEPLGGEQAVGEPAEPDMTGEIAAIHESLDGEEPAPDVEGYPYPPADTESDYFTSDPQIPAEDELGQTAVLEPVVSEEPSEGIDAVPEKRSNAWVWIGLVVGILIAAGAVGYAWWYTTSRPIAVPSVIGKLPAPAVQAINDAGLRLGTVSEIPTEGAPPGTVVEQNPEAFTQLKPGGSVAIVMAASPKGAKVPNVTGQTVDEATAALALERLVGYEIKSYTPTGTPGTVVSQLPTAGAELQPGSVVALAVSKGPAPTQLRVPNVIGTKEADAKTLIAASDLRSAGYRANDASIPVGVVIAQAPIPDSFVSYDTVVQYLVSAGPGVNLVTVPSVAGLSESTAEKRLKDAGLKSKVRRMAHPTVAKGKVIAQLPAANARTARDTVVGLAVSKGAPTSAAVPSLAGLASEEASKTVKSAGFKPVFVEIATAEHPPGQVFGQFPEPATSWIVRLPVIAVVAKQ